MPRPNWFCLPCRFTSKRGGDCPNCHAGMECAGHNWRLPKKTDDKGWKKLVGLIQWKRDRGWASYQSPTHHSGDWTYDPHVPTAKVRAERAYMQSAVRKKYHKRRMALKRRLGLDTFPQV